MQRVVQLTVLDWDSPEAKVSGVRSIKKPFPADPVEDFIDWLRENRQWKNAPEVLRTRALKLLQTLDKVGPLAQEPSGQMSVVAVSTVPAASVVESVPAKAIHCPHCPRTFSRIPGLARHLQSAHPDLQAVES